MSNIAFTICKLIITDALMHIETIETLAIKYSSRYCDNAQTIYVLLALDEEINALSTKAIPTFQRSEIY